MRRESKVMNLRDMSQTTGSGYCGCRIYNRCFKVCSFQQGRKVIEILSGILADLGVPLIVLGFLEIPEEDVFEK